jgi:ABC-type dipeptide/oligopeptide/nickel transport system permease subunit
MNLLLKEIRHNPLLWLLAFVPVVFAAEKLNPEAHTLLFVLSVLAIVPLAALLSHATESVAAKTGDAAGGLLNATLGNLTELVIALAALRAGEYMLVKASIAGAIVTNTLFVLGASFLLGGLKHHVQEYNRVNARIQAGLLFLATVALLIPSAVSEADSVAGAAFTRKLSVGLAVLLIVASNPEPSFFGLFHFPPATEVTGMILILAALGWMPMARIVRGEFLSLREREYVEAARAAGASGPRIVMTHLLPNTVGPIVVFATLAVGIAVLNEAVLSFLGAGIQLPAVSLGKMIADAEDTVGTNFAYLLILPGLVLFVLVLAVNFVGDGLRDALDPRMAKRL